MSSVPSYCGKEDILGSVETGSAGTEQVGILGMILRSCGNTVDVIPGHIGWERIIHTSYRIEQHNCLGCLSRMWSGLGRDS